MKSLIFHLTIPILTALAVLGCESKKVTDTGSIKAMTKIEMDSLIRLDSMKWHFYAVNYFGKALFYDSSGAKIKINPVECEVKLTNYIKLSPDSVIYVFDFLKGGMRFAYVDEMVPCIAIENVKGYIRPIYHLVKWDYEDNPDSLRLHMYRIDTSFKSYIANYKGSLSKWLRQKAMERNIASQ